MSLIFLLEDDATLGKNLKTFLSTQGYRVNWAQDLRTARRLISAQAADLLVLASVLSDGTGLELFESQPPATLPPTIFLTADETDESVLAALPRAEFLRRPFTPEALLTKIKKSLGEAHNPQRILSFLDLKVDVGTKSATFANIKIRLRRREFSILELLVTHSDQVVATESVLEVIDHDGEGLFDRTVDSHVAGLRKALKSAGIHNIEIETVDTTGYRLKRSA